MKTRKIKELTRKRASGREIDRERERRTRVGLRREKTKKERVTFSINFYRSCEVGRVGRSF